MAITNTTNKVLYTGDGSTVDFPYGFKIYADSDLLVTVYTIADGTEDVLTLDTDYTVSGAGEDTGGTVSLLIAAPSSAYKIIIYREIPLTQETDYVENDPFPAESHENALDKLTMICQQLQEQIDRAILQDVTGSGGVVIPAAEADKILGWNSAGTKLENKTGLDAAITACAASQAAAALSETAAETAETNAETAETNAEAAETAAEAAQTAAEAAQAAAEAAVASVDLPTIGAGDADKLLQVKDDVSGYELKTMAQVVTIAGQTEKTTLVDDDLFLIEDSADTNAKKKVKRSTLVAYVGAPTGAIMMWGAAAAPSGWVLCDGASLARVGTYANLFAVIGTTFGAADGDHFNVPNLKGKVPVGFNSAETEFDALGETGGEKTHQLTDAELPAGTYVTVDGGTHYLSLDTAANSTRKTGSGTAHNNLQPYIALNFIIKT